MRFSSKSLLRVERGYQENIVDAQMRFASCKVFSCKCMRTGDPKKWPSHCFWKWVSLLHFIQFLPSYFIYLVTPHGGDLFPSSWNGFCARVESYRLPSLSLSLSVSLCPSWNLNIFLLYVKIGATCFGIKRPFRCLLPNSSKCLTNRRVGRVMFG